MVSQAETTNMCSTQYSLQTIQTSCLLLTVEGPGVPHLVGGGGANVFFIIPSCPHEFFQIQYGQCFP